MKTPLNSERIAHDGFRKLPGSATPELGSSTYEHHTNEYTRKPLGIYKDPGAGNIKEIEGAEMGKDKQLPPDADAATRSMSAKHHADTVRYDIAHAKDHEKDAAKHERALKKLRK